MNPIQGTVNWGIIGCGDVCEVKSGPAFNQVENSKLVAVMRRDGVKAKEYALRHGVAKYYADAQQLIADEEVNAIYIATPPAFHEAYALQAMAAGKPVYIEKPVTLNSESCQRMIEASHQYGIPATVAHYRRGLPLFQKVRTLVQEGAIGQVRLIRMDILQPFGNPITDKTEDNWRVNPALSGGGLFHDLAPHQLDILYWIFGAPTKLHGWSLNQSNQYQVPDMTLLEAVFQNATCFSGVWAFSVSPGAAQDRCEILGDKGTLSFAFFRQSALTIQTESGTERLDFQYPANIQQPMIREVVRFFREEGPNPCSLEEALISMRMMDCPVHH